MSLVCLLLAAFPARAENHQVIGDLKAYLTKIKEKKLSVLDAYITGGDGKSLTIRELAKGRPVVLHFWASWCGPCIGEMPALAELAGEVKDKDVLVLALSEDFAGVAKVQEFYKQKNITTLEPYVDIMTGAANTVDVTALPVTVLVGRDGKIVEKTDGIVHWDEKETRDKIGKLVATSGTQGSPRPE